MNKIKFEIDEYLLSLTNLDKAGIHSLSNFITNIYNKYRNYFINELKEIGNEYLSLIEPTVLNINRNLLKIKSLIQYSISRKESKSIGLSMNSIFLVLLIETIKECTHKCPSILLLIKKILQKYLSVC